MDFNHERVSERGQVLILLLLALVGIFGFGCAKRHNEKSLDNNLRFGKNVGENLLTVNSYDENR